MLTRAQINELSNLGAQLGNPGIYRRLLKERVQVGFREVEETAQVRTKTGQVINVETAIRKGLLPISDKDGNKTPLTNNVQKPVYGPLGFDQMKNMLLNAVELKEIQGMPTAAQILYVAYKFNTRDLKNIPYLVVDEKNKFEYDQLFTLIPEDRKEEITKLVVPRGNPQVFCVDGSQFLQELVFTINHNEAATEMYNGYLTGDFGDLTPKAEAAPEADVGTDGAQVAPEPVTQSSEA